MMSAKDAVSAMTRSTLLSTIANPPIPTPLRTLYDRTRTILPAEILSRSPSYLTLAELQSILEYKLAFGVKRPFLMSMLKKNSDAAVREVSQRAFAVAGLEDADVGWEAVKEAMGIVCELKGVGPALGSLVLSLLYATGVPFFSDETAV